jgi:hypothetical protein
MRVVEDYRTTLHNREPFATRLRNTLIFRLFLVAPGRLERPAYGLGNRRSVQLSYGA